MPLLNKLRRDFTAQMVPFLPRKLRTRLVPEEYAWGRADLKPVASPPDKDAKTRLLIAPANYATQAYQWAQAANLLEGVSATNLQFVDDSARTVGASHSSVDAKVGKSSHIWARRQRREILSNFTHVLYESERPILSGLYDGDVAAEIRDLRAHGVKVATVSHGSDVRTPSKHVEIEKFSPFVEELHGLSMVLEGQTAENHALLQQLDVPKFVSTPDLLEYVPDATWLPTLTDPGRWERLEPSQLGERIPVVLHVPSSSALKGTAAIRAAMLRLQEDGLIDYVEMSGVPPAQMPAVVEKADIVIDQVGMGLYGVASVEAMLAGRIVVAQAGDFIRDQIREITGWELPIVEANPETIYSVVHDVVSHPGKYLHLQGEGRRFARGVHSHARAAEALAPFLIHRGMEEDK